MKKIEAIIETLNVYQTGNIEAINIFCAEQAICYNLFVDRIIGKNNISNHIKKNIDAFSDMTIDFNIDKINQLFYVKFNFVAIHSGILFDLLPTNKKVDIPGYAIYKMQDDLITKSYVSLDISSLIAQGSFPFYMANDNNDILSAINTTCNSKLTAKEAYIASLWARGYSIKETSFMVNISCRTIEDYRARIKDKLKILNKNNLYDYLKSLKIIDLFFSFSEQTFIWHKPKNVYTK